jgi:taurine dioxygenase
MADRAVRKDAMMRVRKAAGALGAWVEGVDLEGAAQSAALFDDIEGALLEHAVLFFRGQDLDPVEFQAFARQFGPVEPHPAYPTVRVAPDVQILESTPERPSKIEVWHSDMTFRPAPPAVTLLHAQLVPPFGGDTLWASAAAAYDALSEPMRTLLDGLRAVHDFRHGFRESLAEPGGTERLAGAIADNPPVCHPLVRTHPRTGRRAIYVNPLFTTGIEGLTRAESDALLGFLFPHVVTEEFTVRLSWEVHTVAIWDNRVTLHKPVNDFLSMHRRMHRVTIAGERPV